MSSDRLTSIRSRIDSLGEHSLLITAQEDIRWACGFSGSNGALLVFPDGAILFTDGRYATQAPEEAVGVEVEIVSGDFLEAVGEAVAPFQLKSIAIDSATTPVSSFRRMQSWSDPPIIRPFESPLAPLMVSKDSAELDLLRAAQKITDAVFEEIIPLIRPGVSESELAAEIVYRHLRRGAERMSFEPIVASGSNAALPHARSSERKLGTGELIVLDFGCFYRGYASDMTRTVGLGTPEPDAVAAYRLVQDAQAAAQGAARSGMRCSDLDAVARKRIEAAGFGDAFSHSLGHGIGVRIHERPRVSSSNDRILPENAVVTIEPGVYIPGRFGVRIENAVILRAGGCEALPESSTDLLLL